MAEEIRLHVELETAELERSGVPPEEARRQALVAFGGVERTKEEVRDVRIVALVALTLLAVSALASLIPAIRATRVNPVAALQAE